jgi:hypothetical protein
MVQSRYDAKMRIVTCPWASSRMLMLLGGCDRRFDAILELVSENHLLF